MTTPLPFSVPGGAISVTATSEGLLTPPAPAGQSGYNFAIVSNCTSWLTTISGAAGTSTLQPYTADIIPVTLSQVLSYQMSVPPGGNPVPIPNLNTYLQADWFTAGNASPSGTYPVALVSQAITAAIAGIVGTYQALSPGQLGTAADGVVVISANTTLTRNMNYSSLTVNNGVTLETGGYIIFCTGTVTCNGQIDNSGSPGTSGAAGGPGSPYLFAGGNGGTAGANGSAPGGGTAQGGKGGVGDNGITNGGAVVVAPLGAYWLTALTTNTYGGGSGGGGGSAGGAGGGGGGGVVMIFCGALAGSGSITANGGPGPTSPSGTWGSGGGGGGIVFIACSSSTFTGTITVTGGTGGIGTSGNGLPGNQGIAVLIA